MAPSTGIKGMENGWKEKGKNSRKGYLQNQFSIQINFISLADLFFTANSVRGTTTRVM